MDNSPSEEFESNKRFYRLVHLIKRGVRPALRYTLHNGTEDKSYKGLLREPAELYNHLNEENCKAAIEKLRKKNIICQDEYDLLLPSNKQTDSILFDVTLLVVCIRNFINLPQKNNKWEYAYLDETEKFSLKGYVIRGRDLRNTIFHYVQESIDEPLFNNLWVEGEAIMQGLSYTCNTDLKKEPLDDNPHTSLEQLKIEIEESRKGRAREMDLLVLRGLSYFTFEYEYDSTNENIIREEVEDNNGKRFEVHDCHTTKEKKKKGRVDCPVNGTYKILVEVEHKDGNYMFMKRGTRDVKVDDFQGHVSSKWPIRMVMHNRLKEIPTVLEKEVHVTDLDGVQYCKTIEEWDNLCDLIWECYHDKIDMTLHIEEQSNLLKRLKEHCEKLPFYSLFLNYNPSRHLENLGEKVADAIEGIRIDSKVVRKDATILCDAGSNSVFYMQRLDSKKDFKFNLEVLWQDLMIFASLHQDIAPNMEFNLCGLLFTEDYTKDNLRDQRRYCCTECIDLCLTKEILNSEKSFSDWRSAYIRRYIEKFKKNKCEKWIDKERLCRKISSRITASLSKDYNDLPNPFDSIFTRIQKLPLTSQQKEVVKDNPDHLFITGNFGSGKTIVARKMLQKLFAECSTGSSIFFLSDEPVTALISEMIAFVEDYKKLEECPTNLRIICFDGASKEEIKDEESYINVFIMTMGEFVGLKNLPTDNKLLGIIEKVSVGKENQHLFVDEYDAENLTTNVASSIKCLLDNDAMKGKKIVIAAQAIEKERTISGEVTEAAIDRGYKYPETGMSVVKLVFCMRHTQNIDKVLKCAAEVLESYETEFNCPFINEERETFPRTKQENEENVNEKNGDEETKAEKEQARQPSSIVEKATETKMKEQTIQPSSSVGKITETKIDLTVDDNELKALELKGHPKSNLQLKSNFRVLKNRPGHSMKGERVRLVKPFPGVIDEKNVEINLCHLDEAMIQFECLRPGTMIICFDYYEKTLFEKMFELDHNKNQELFVYCPSIMNSDEGRDEFYKAYKEKIRVLLTDYRGARGLEMENVVVIMSNKEKYLAPYYTEAFSRATCDLYLVYFNWNEQNTNSFTNLLEEKLKQNCLISKHVLKECDDDEDCYPTTNITTIKETGEDEEILVCHHDHNSRYENVYGSKKFEIKTEELPMEDIAKKYHQIAQNRFGNLKQDVDEVAIKPEKYTEDKHSLDEEQAEKNKEVDRKFEEQTEKNKEVDQKFEEQAEKNKEVDQKDEEIHQKFKEIHQKSTQGTSSHLTDLKEEGVAELHDIRLRIINALPALRNTLEALLENIGREITGKSDGSDALVHLLQNASIQKLKKIPALNWVEYKDKWFDSYKHSVKNSIDLSTFDVTLLIQLLENLSVLLKQKLNNHCTTCTLEILHSNSGRSSCIECGKVKWFVTFVRVLRRESLSGMETNDLADFAAGKRTICGFINEADLFQHLHQLNGDCVSFLRDANLLTNPITKDQGNKLIKSVYSALYDPF